MNIIKKAFPIMLAGTVVFNLISPLKGFAQSENPTVEENKTSENYSILLKSPNQTERFLKMMKDQFPELQATVIEEIGLIYMNQSEYKNVMDQVGKVNPEINHLIEAKGELPEITAPSKTLQPNQHLTVESIQKPIEEDISHQHSKSYSFPALTSPYFLPFNWYLEDVTGQYKSHLIDKGDHSTIALIDSGVDVNHPLLKDQIHLEKAKSYVTNDSNVEDELGHGTSVAGILASIAPNSTIVPYKVLGAMDGESVWVIEAIIDAAKDQSDVINLSLGTYKTKNNEDERLLIEAYDKAVKYAKKQGSVVVASVGNQSLDLDDLKREKELHLPGGLHSLITVSSHTKEDQLASYSNIGKEVDFSAPGGDLSFTNEGLLDITGMVITTFPSDRPNTFIDQIIGIPQGYTLSYGTSLSAPQVSATAALIMSEYKEKTGKELNVQSVIKYLKRGSTDIGRKGKDKQFGEGKINAYESLMMLK